MADLLSHTAGLGFKMLVLAAVTYALTWYFIVNPSFPGGLGVLVALFSVFGFAYIILSSVDSMIEEKAA